MRPPAFLIVGTPRSGTTLVQRLASDLEGVRVPPETHFFTDFAWSLDARWKFPLALEQLREVLDDYARRPYMRQIGFDVDAAIGRLEGACPSMLDLYAAIVEELGGSAAILGEKTPAHLLWWRPLTTAWPELKMVCVLRDPRAVVASQLQTGWCRHHAMTAERWRDDVRRVRSAARALGPARCLVLRYEDAVDSAERTRGDLASFLGTSAELVAAPGSDRALFAPWERWKEAALGPVDPGRAMAWRDVLDPRHGLDVEALCHAAITDLGYVETMTRSAAARRRARLSPVAQARRVQYRLHRWRRDHGIARIVAGWTRAGGESPLP